MRPLLQRLPCPCHHSLRTQFGAQEAMLLHEAFVFKLDTSLYFTVFPISGPFPGNICCSHSCQRCPDRIISGLKYLLDRGIILSGLFARSGCIVGFV